MRHIHIDYMQTTEEKDKDIRTAGPGDTVADTAGKVVASAGTRGARFASWCESHMGPYVFMCIVAVVIGLASGLAAHVFKRLVGYVASLFIARIDDAGVNWWIVAVPVIGILLTCVFTHYVVKCNLTHGVAILIRDIKGSIYDLQGRLTFSPIIGGILTLGLGGSSGAEGPIAYSGAAIGSNIGKTMGITGQRLRILVACGASAGIAGIFTAPVGGFLFSVELLGIALTTSSVMLVMISALTAYLAAFACTGFTVDLAFVPVGVFDYSTLPLVILLGIGCGLYSLYYSSVINFMDRIFSRMSNFWLRALMGGCIVGLILLVFPSMFSIGYPVVGDVINGSPGVIERGSLLRLLDIGDKTMIAVLIGVLLMKCWAVTSTNSSGGVGGDFAPTLFAGSFAGLLFAIMCSRYMGVELPGGMFAFIGMAGVMAGVVQAPVMSIFIVLEMTQSFSLALPVAICALVSYLTVRLGSLTSRYYPVVKHLLWNESRHVIKK